MTEERQLALIDTEPVKRLALRVKHYLQTIDELKQYHETGVWPVNQRWKPDELPQIRGDKAEIVQFDEMIEARELGTELVRMLGNQG